jgi:predicted PurR-regulated permease PerM
MIRWRIVLWAVLVLAALAFLFRVRDILPPFLLAFIISAMLEPLVRRCEQRGMSRLLSVFSILTSFCVVGIIALVLIVPAVWSQVSGIRDRVEELVATITRASPDDNFFVSWNPVAIAHGQGTQNPLDQFLQSQQSLLASAGLPTRTSGFMHQFVEPHRTEIGKWVQNFFVGFLDTAGGNFSHIMLLFFTPLLVFLILVDLNSLGARGKNLIPQSIREGAVRILQEIYDVFGNYLRGVSKAILGYMTMMCLVLTLAQAPYGIVLGMLAGIIYLIPYLGGAISMVLIFIVIGLGSTTGAWYIHTPSTWAFAAVVLVWFFAAHLAYDSILYPRLVGKSVGLNPVVSMFVILSGGAIGGILGMLVAFPLAGAVKVILDRLLAVSLNTQETLNLPSVPLRHRHPTG